MRRLLAQGGRWARGQAGSERRAHTLTRSLGSGWPTPRGAAGTHASVSTCGHFLRLAASCWAPAAVNLLYWTLGREMVLRPGPRDHPAPTKAPPRSRQPDLSPAPLTRPPRSPQAPALPPATQAPTLTPTPAATPCLEARAPGSRLPRRRCSYCTSCGNRGQGGGWGRQAARAPGDPHPARMTALLYRGANRPREWRLLLRGHTASPGKAAGQVEVASWLTLPEFKSQEVLPPV